MHRSTHVLGFVGFAAFFVLVGIMLGLMWASGCS